MDLQPLWDDGPVIAVHALVAVAAFGLGTAQLALPKGTRTHRLCGYGWAAAMAAVAVSSFWIHEFRTFGPFSVIHLLSLLVLVSLWRAIYLARRGRIAEHRRVMLSLYGLALVLTGLFTLWPGRTMHAVLFGT